MIKKILVGIDTSDHSKNAQQYAFYFARIFNASLIGLHVVDIVSIEGSFFHDISGSLGLEPYLDFSSKMREVLTARGR
ncbi:MAG: universal stress protein, partial [Candidatus Binatus sp.]